MTQAERRLLTEKEAARILGIGATTLATWRKEGRAVPPSIRVGSKTLVYDRSEVECWRDEHPTAKRQVGRSHGTRGKYREGCRCEACISANREVQKRTYQRRKARAAEGA